MAANIRFNEDESRYEEDFDGHIVYANVRQKDDIFYIDYVFSPSELRGSGAAGRFMKDMMDHIQNNTDAKVKPICGYAAHWIRKHEKEYKDILG